MRLPCVAVLLLTAQAHAFVPGDDAFVVDGPPARRARTVTEARSGAWRIERDRDLGTVTQMWGSHVDVPGANADAAIAERAARAFLAQHLLPAGTRIEDFVVVANRVDDGKRTVAFVQSYAGLRVAGGQMHVVFARDRLFYAGSDAYPNVSVTIAKMRAKPQRAATWAKTALVDTGARVVLPIVRSGNVEYRVADVFDAPAKRWDVYVAPDGAPIARRARLSAATSTLQYDVGARYPGGARMNAPAPSANITVDAASTTTDAAGMFAWGTSSPATVVPGLVGSFVRIVDDEGNPLATATLTAQPGVPVVWSEAASEVNDAQLAAYIYANHAKTIGRRIAPTLPWLDQLMDVHVNGTASSCNAFSTGDSLLFYRATVDCENTARVADVVFHEFGHSFHAQNILLGLGGAADASITEGLADFFAANVTSDPGIGRGFHFTDAAVRELDPVGDERIYPRDLSAISHVTGLIIAGTLWDLRKQLGVAKTEKVFLGILQRASDLTKTFTAALVADDDDGDLGNGTPNYCAIENAFGRHGLAGSSFEQTALAVPVLDGRRVSVTVETPTGAACPPAQVTSMTLRWRVGTAPLADVAMSRQGTTWTAELPEQPDGTVLEYQVVAALDTSETLLRPGNPADPLYQVFVGTPMPIWCEHFDADPMWKTEGLDWEVATSSASAIAVGDPPAAYDGALWLGLDLHADGRYRSNTLTSIETPLVDATTYGRVHLQFRRWLGIEDAALDVATIRINGMQIWANASNSDFTLDHVDREWRFVDFDITQLAAEPLSVKWTLASNDSRSLGGWNLDEVCIVGLDKRPLCGDGIRDPGEQCDDDTGACSPTCQIVTGGGGGCCSTSDDSFVSMLSVLGLLQLTSFVRKRASRRRPSRSVSLRMP